ncbi:uncharacterized protein METZ01_LOCUS391156, partial [marine metagenome]
MKTRMFVLSGMFTTALFSFAQTPVGLYGLAVHQRNADNLFKAGDYENALKTYQYVLAQRLPKQGNRHHDIGVVYNNMGVALYFSGE